MNQDNIEKEFIEIYEKYADSIFRHIFFRIYDREIAKEIMQETFTKTWSYICRKGHIENLKAFLYKVAKNETITYIRKNKTISLENLMESGFQPKDDTQEKKFQMGYEVGKTIKAIEKLPAKYSEILKLKFLEDLSLKEISTLIGKSENVISVRINRALAKLKKDLNYLL